MYHNFFNKDSSFNSASIHYQDELEKNQSGSKSTSAAMNAEIAELNSKLEVATKNLETQRAANRELEVR